jgi:hypothetical protein
MSPVIAKHGVRRLSKKGPQGDLVPHSSREKENARLVVA